MGGQLSLRVAFVGMTALVFWALPARADDDNPPQGPAAVAVAAPLRIAVMDPLCDKLACDCAAGYARRDYQRLAEFLHKELGQKVEIAYAETLASPQAGVRHGLDLVIGKFSEVVFDADRADLKVRTVAMLTGKDGAVTQDGLFVVRGGDPARSIQDLRGYRILLGPKDALEKHAAATATLEAFNLPLPKAVPTSPSCSAAALAVVEKEADAAVISSYAMPLLEGCETIDKGALRIVGRTDPVPFICVFATTRVGKAAESKLVGALRNVGNHPLLSAALESRDGFIRLSGIGGDGPAAARWNDWRGPHRDALCKHVPQGLPQRKRLLWQRTLTGQGMSGLAVDSGCVVVADKDLRQQQDIFRCLDADTGSQNWKLVYPAAGEMDFTNSPRANPVIHRGLVYLLGAFGDLHCVELAGGKLVWKKQLIGDFGGKLPHWGISPAPLLVGDKLIVTPGAKDASIAALDRLTGKLLWATPGGQPGYASFIIATFGGVRQIVGYDQVSLGGWDPETGKRLWRLVPEFEGDFNVPTPIAVDGKLLVSTENNGTRLFGFDPQGRIIPKPLAANEDLIPDTSTPVVLDGMVLGTCGRLVCLDLERGLKTLWEVEKDPFGDYCSLIAGNGRVLVTTQVGKIFLGRPTRSGFDSMSSLELFDDQPDDERDIWSHPALVDNRFYLRNLLGVSCFLLETRQP